jgi:hypothetical protein
LVSPAGLVRLGEVADRVGLTICRREHAHPGTQLSLFDTVEGVPPPVPAHRPARPDIASLAARSRLLRFPCSDESYTYGEDVDLTKPPNSLGSMFW